MSSMPIFDKAEALKMLGGDEEIFYEIVKVYKESQSETVAKLSGSIGVGNEIESRLHAHSLKSAARTIGGMAVGEVCSQMEECALQGNIRGAAALFSQLTLQLDDLDSALSEYMKTRENTK